MLEHGFELRESHLFNLCALLLSRFQFFEIPWTVACQAPLSMGFTRKAYWRGLPFPSPGIEPGSSALAGRYFTTEPPWKPLMWSTAS